MRSEIGKKHHIPVTLSILMTLAFYLLFILTHPVYFHPDNWEVSVVTSGYYGDNICQYLHPFLCLIIKAIGCILPSADVFTLLVHLGIGAGCTVIFYLTFEYYLSSVRHSLTYLVLLADITLGVLYITQELRIWNANYNIQTGAVLFFGMILFFTVLKEQRSKSLLLLSTVMIVFGFTLRVAVAYLFIPYFFLEIADYYLENRNNIVHIKRMIKHLVPIIIAVLVLCVSRFILLSVEPFKTAEAYNHFRTIAVDYPMKEWSKSNILTISQADYEAATDWTFFDTKNLDLQRLKSIADAGTTNEFEYSDVRGILKEMWRTVKNIDIYMFLMLILTGILLVRNLICSNNTLRKIESLLSVLGSFVILYYFTARGRAPLRVWQPVLFATNGVLIGVFLSDYSKRNSSVTKEEIIPDEKNEGRKRYRLIWETGIALVLFVVLWYGAGQFLAHIDFCKPQNILTARIGADDSVYVDTFEEDAIYIWPNWSATIPDYFIEIGKLPTKRVMEHNIAAGDWTYGQVYYLEYLERLGIPNPAEALFERDDVFLMDGNMETILNLLREHYGRNIEAEEIGQINGTKAYRVYRESPVEETS